MLIVEIVAGVIVAFIALPWWRELIVLGGAAAVVGGTIYVSEWATPVELGSLVVVAALIGLGIWAYSSAHRYANA